jgi:hypothetical protein
MKSGKLCNEISHGEKRIAMDFPNHIAFPEIKNFNHLFRANGELPSECCSFE